jgi:GNAT superfamily N-acetyltransferase
VEGLHPRTGTGDLPSGAPVRCQAGGVPVPVGGDHPRPAQPYELPRLREIENASETLFTEVGIGPFPPDDVDHLTRAVVVFVAGDPPVGFASVGVVDGEAHIWQLSVDPVSGRQGRGTSLVMAVCDWAAANGYDAVTLTTFRDVPWNAPFYARMGFAVVDEPSGDLAEIRRHEQAIGDDAFGARVAMRKLLGRPFGEEARPDS